MLMLNDVMLKMRFFASLMMERGRLPFWRPPPHTATRSRVKATTADTS
jgi:hypothetical protein